MEQIEQMNNNQQQELQLNYEQQELQLNYLKRQAIVEKYKTFIHQLTDTKKNIRYRQFLRGYLMHTANKHFKTEDEEYTTIGKWGRGAWDCEKLEKFNKTDYEIIREIAREFGAFSY